MESRVDSEKTVQGWDAHTGKLLWVNRSGEIYGLVSAGPYFFAGSKNPEGVIVIDAQTGATGWKPPSVGRGALELYDPKDGVLLTSRYAADARSGKILKYWPTEWDVSSAALARNLVVIGTSSTGGGSTRLAAYLLPDFQMEWVRDDARKRYFGAVAADGDHVVAAIYPDKDFKDTSYGLPGIMEVQVLTASSGKLLWLRRIKCPFLGEGSPPVGLLQGWSLSRRLTRGDFRQH